MKIDFLIPKNEIYRQYCLACRSEKVERIFIDGKTFYECSSCNEVLERSLVIDNKIVWWIDQHTKEYWHESVGVVVFTPEKDVLMFKRTIYPFVYTIPAGHLDVGELPEVAAMRELKEEVGLQVDELNFLLEENVIGDSCRRGSDSHKWHLYNIMIKEIPQDLEVIEEGTEIQWIAFSELKNMKDIPFPLRCFIDRYSDKLVE